MLQCYYKSYMDLIYTKDAINNSGRHLLSCLAMIALWFGLSISRLGNVPQLLHLHCLNQPNSHQWTYVHRASSGLVLA